MAHIGFVGLGHMGLPMAIHLVNSGHVVVGFDIDAKAREAFREANGRVADSVKTIGPQEIYITMLQNGKQVLDVALGPNGLFHQASPMSLYLDCSSIDVASTKHLHQEAEKRKILALDAPVSGGVGGAKSGSLTFMVGGQEDAFEKAKPILNCMGKKIIFTGGSGSGQAAKICNNMILGISMIGISEAFTLAKKLGLSEKKLFEVVTNSSGQCWAMSQYVPVAGILPQVPANHGFEPGFTAAMMQKDLNLSQNEADLLGIKTPLGQLATQLYQQFNEEGHGGLDFSAIIQKIQNEDEKVPTI